VLPTTLHANALYLQGKHAEAESMYRKTLAVDQRVSGPEHPQTLATVTNLANTLLSQGNYAEAETTYRAVLAIQQRVLGPEHPNTMKTAKPRACVLPAASQATQSDADTSGLACAALVRTVRMIATAFPASSHFKSAVVRYVCGLGQPTLWCG
jgi:tetratricopeptide (TPR) repeat protein